MGRTFNPEDEIYVDDQCCRNCKWWNPDILTDKIKCHNYRSEYKGEETSGEVWCWCWQGSRGRRYEGD